MTEDFSFYDSIFLVWSKNIKVWICCFRFLISRWNLQTSKTKTQKLIAGVFETSRFLFVSKLNFIELKSFLGPNRTNTEDKKNLWNIWLHMWRREEKNLFNSFLLTSDLQVDLSRFISFKRKPASCLWWAAATPLGTDPIGLQNILLVTRGRDWRRLRLKATRWRFLPAPDTRRRRRPDNRLKMAFLNQTHKARGDKSQSSVKSN